MEALPPPSSKMVGRGDQRVMLWNVAWDDYEAILRMRGESGAIRVAYLDLELVARCLTVPTQTAAVKALMGELRRRKRKRH